jgi:ribosomal protein L11 methyltransferase
MQWTGIAISAPTDETEEVVTKLLLSAGCAGVALSGEGKTRQVTSYLPNDDNTAHRITQISAALSLLPSIGVTNAGQVETSVIDELDWANAWKAYFKPLRIGRHLVVSPPWEEPILGEQDLLITIDPGMAFGTGTHATTQMCLVLLEDYLKPGNTVADIGTGSGILSIAAQKLGSGVLIAVDNDPLAVKIAGENAVVNNTSVTVQEAFPSGRQFDVVVANIIADTLISLANDLASITSNQGILIVSGVIDDRQNDVRMFIEAAGFSSLETRTQGEWVALVFRRLSS